MINRHMEKVSTPEIISEIQIKTTRRYSFILVRMNIIKNTINNVLTRKWAKENPHEMLVKMKLMQPLWKK